MKINTIILTNIKKFGPKGAVFNFFGQEGIFTVSGGNGSGKTAIFKAIQMVQKIVFFDQLVDNEEKTRIKSTLWSDVDGLLSDSYGVIDVQFKDGSDSNNHFAIRLQITKSHEAWSYKFQDCENELNYLVENYWNIKNPKNIIAFIDAGKSFSEFGVSFESIRLSTRRDQKQKLILDCVFEPERTLQSIYRKTVIDHIQYRLDPKRTYDYFKYAKYAIAQISENIKIANVSSTKNDGHLVIVGKTSDEAPLFDVKDFSSGERSLYLTLLFLYYLPNIGILIIDEPENHLHESLLCRFYDFLLNFISNENLNDDYLESFTTDIKQIFLTTHSRALIIRNIDNGICFAMGNNEVHPIANSSAEHELRAMGISAIQSRTIFVEGKTEVSILSEFFERERIKVISANSCNEVINYFQKISKIRGSIYGASFCFIIDGDNMSPSRREEIRNIDPTFFDESFHILECHEIENLLIDENLMFDVCNELSQAIDENSISRDEITQIMHECKEKTASQSRLKYISSEVEILIKNTISNNITNIKNLQSKDVKTLIIESINQTTIDDLIENSISIESRFDQLWKEDWALYVDGKSYIGNLLQKLSTRLGVKSEKIKNKIWRHLGKNDAKYKFTEFMTIVKNKFDQQTSNHP